MKTLLLSLVVLSANAFAQNKPMVTTYTVDTEKTQITYVGKKITGQHTGTMKVKNGNLVFTGPELTGGEIVVDMNSMTVTDLTDAETAGKFLGHMKSADFFDTAKHPESKLVIKSTKMAGKDLEVTGDLTMIGKTQPVTFKVTNWKWTDKEVTGSTKLAIDRTKYGLQYGSSSFIKGLGDKAIHNEFTLDINLRATR
ncbi:MAG: YceI family protein [Bdellovibrionota bacterium]